VSNRLANETSPYLQQHADNPVDWYPWGEEAFAAARERNVPIHLSVGYSACHWCHVMAHESFEDPATAEVMNAQFVNVKVDREERPDVDAIYMEATTATTGSGGWPMTVFMTPDGEPFFCGTYFPKVGSEQLPSFVDLCNGLAHAWETQRSEILERAAQIAAHVRGMPNLPPVELPGVAALTALRDAAAGVFDDQFGGLGSQPKFPHPLTLDGLLRIHRRSPDPTALNMAVHSLDAMCAGGIYDHLGGGFARYSVDDRWLVPHFEKMLYDNALLIRPYLHSWQLTGNEAHLEVVDQTIEYVLRDLQVRPGAFASAEDADSPVPDRPGHNEEGRFSTWTPTEIRDAVGAADASLLIEHYGVTDEGNFEGRSILFRPIGGFLRDDATETARQRLFAAREQRQRPGRDDKVLTEWNALFLASLAEAAGALQRDDWADVAVTAGEFLLANLRREDGRWLRSWQGGSARHLAVAVDVAAVADAMLRLYELTGEARWLNESLAAADQLMELFWMPEEQLMATTGSDAEALISRPVEVQDGVIPSPQSQAAAVFLRLAPLTERWDLADVADELLSKLGSVATQAAMAVGHLSWAAGLEADGVSEVVIVGDRPDLLTAVRQGFHPNAVVSWGEPLPGSLWEGREPGKAYVCRNHVCRLPADTPDSLIGQLAEA
jgi:uncharacterized protein YyaL (SSP411 family)